MPRSNELQPTAYGETIKVVKKINRQAALIMARKLPLLKTKGSYGRVRRSWPAPRYNRFTPCVPVQCNTAGRILLVGHLQ
jgi:hypothetical protein